jgi:hypothetical protein
MGLRFNIGASIIIASIRCILNNIPIRKTIFSRGEVSGKQGEVRRLRQSSLDDSCVTGGVI